MKTSKSAQYAASICAAIALTACGSSVNDSFFQASGTAKGTVCIDDMFSDPSAEPTKLVLANLMAFYGKTDEISVVVSARGYGANCGSYSHKSKPDVTIDVAYYEQVIVPTVRQK